jgi:arylsulfatase A-like enzyme
VQCLYVRLDELFQQMQTAGIFENSIIILHGDHGARIGIHDPYIEDLALLSREDYVDAFSTLFAVKFPGKPGGYNASIKPLEELLAETVGVLPKSIPKSVAGGPEPFVYLMSRNRREFVPVFYPAHR